MIPSEYDPLIKKLTERTEEGAVKWETTSDDDKFMARIGKNSVAISNYIHCNTNLPTVSFEMLDIFGDTIDFFCLSSNDFEYQTVYSLYALAKRKALNIDATIDQLMRDLD